MIDAWFEGGWPMYPVLAFGVTALCLAVAACFAQAVPVKVAAAIVALLPLSVGAVGNTLNRAGVDSAVEYANEADRELIRQGGYAEAKRPLQLGGLLSGVALPLALASFVLRRKR